MRLLSIADVEGESGLPRTTIYHYLKIGLLSPAQRVGGGPAVYSTRHLARLKQIQGLKEEGFTLEEIRTRVEPGDEGDSKDVDLLARQAQATRSLIVATAAAQFSRQGYRSTKMADIAAAAGIGPLTLYRFFAAKRELFIEAVDVLVERALKHTESLILPEADDVKRYLLRVRGFLEVRDISREMLTFIRAEALVADPAARRFLVRTYEALTKALTDDLRILREDSGTTIRSSDEIMAYALLGIMEETAMRLQFDDCYSIGDYLWVNLEAYLPIRAQYAGRGIPKDEAEKYHEIISGLASGPLFSL
jgi:AcrR family transcriptional regulator